MNQSISDRLIEATVYRTPARIVYEDAKGNRTIRGVTVRSVRDDGTVVCDCLKRNAIRTFRLDRIKHVFPGEAPKTPAFEGDAFEGLF